MTNSSTRIISDFANLRWLVALLGSKKNFAWWDCSFLDETGLRFLSNPFPRTALEAALEATTEAAQRVHDSALGRIGCYHLFRLPIALEDKLIHSVSNGRSLLPREAALAELSTIAGELITTPEGPVQIGTAKGILKAAAIRELAAHYHSAFAQGIHCYPYFSTGDR